jgi:hypothetical protein
MKATDIKVGDKYLLKLTERMTVVRVLKEKTVKGYRITKLIDKRTWEVEDLHTGRVFTVTSATRFRRGANNMDVERLCKPATRPSVRDWAEGDGTVEEFKGGPTTPADKRRLEQIESKYSTERGATEAERQEAQAIVEGVTATTPPPAPKLVPMNELPPDTRITHYPLKYMLAVLRWCEDNGHDLSSIAPLPGHRRHFVIRAVTGENLFDRLVRVEVVGYSVTELEALQLTL